MAPLERDSGTVTARYAMHISWLPAKPCVILRPTYLLSIGMSTARLVGVTRALPVFSASGDGVFFRAEFEEEVFKIGLVVGSQHGKNAVHGFVRVLVARAAAPEKVALLAETVPYDWAFYEDGADAGPVKWALFSKQVVPYCWPDETRMRWILAKHPTLPPPEPFGDMHTEIEYYANNSPPEHLSPAKNSGSSIELNFRDDNWNNDEWIRAQPASKSAELLFRLEHFLVFE